MGLLYYAKALLRAYEHDICTMGCLGSTARKILLFVASLLQAAVAAGMIYVVASELQTVDIRPGTDSNGVSNDSTATCLLSKDINDNALCLTAYAGVGVTFAAML